MKSIHIYESGCKEIFALVKDGKQTVARGRARCNPHDEYDFETGAKLAMERAFVDSREDEPFPDWSKCLRFVGIRDNFHGSLYVKTSFSDGSIADEGWIPEAQWRRQVELSPERIAELACGRYTIHKKTTPKGSPEVREVHRPAKVGEWVKVINRAPGSHTDYAIGDILKIIGVTDSDGEHWAHYKDKCGRFLYDKEYDVLEGYQPGGKG